MKFRNALLSSVYFIGFFGVAHFSPYFSSEARADEFCRPCPFDCAGIGARDDDCRQLRSRYGQCCVDLDGRGQDQLRRRDAENSGYGYGYGRDERCGGGRDGYHGRNDYGYNNYGYGNGYGNYDRRRNDPNAYDDRNGYQPGDCPFGYHVNDRNCTNDERSRGCRDLRSPSGQICVGWGNNRRH